MPDIIRFWRKYFMLSDFETLAGTYQGLVAPNILSKNTYCHEITQKSL